MKPLAPWQRPDMPHPSDREARMLWWQRVAFWALAAAVVAALWR